MLYLLTKQLFLCVCIYYLPLLLVYHMHFGHVIKSINPLKSKNKKKKKKTEISIEEKSEMCPSSSNKSQSLVVPFRVYST